MQGLVKDIVDMLYSITLKPACDVASSSGGGAKPPCSEACS